MGLFLAAVSTVSTAPLVALPATAIRTNKNATGLQSSGAGRSAMGAGFGELSIAHFSAVVCNLNERDRHPPPCGMDRKQAQARLDRIRDTPARNWRERRQKARVIAEAYKRRKPKPVWDSPF